MVLGGGRLFIHSQGPMELLHMGYMGVYGSGEAPVTVEALLLTYGVDERHPGIPQGCAMVDIYQNQRYPVIKVAPGAQT